MKGFVLGPETEGVRATSAVQAGQGWLSGFGEIEVEVRLGIEVPRNVLRKIGERGTGREMLRLRTEGRRGEGETFGLEGRRLEGDDERNMLLVCAVV